MALNVNDNEIRLPMILEEMRRINLEFGEILYRVQNIQLTYISKLESVAAAAEKVSQSIHDKDFLVHFRGLIESLEVLHKHPLS